MEIWQPIPDFSGYEASPSGAIRNAAKGNVLKPFLRGRYPCVRVRNKEMAPCLPVHRLVLAAFAGPAPDGHVGAHMDGNRLNPALSNLRWVTPQENERHKIAHGRSSRGQRSTQARFTDEEAAIIREAHDLGLALAKIAAITRVTTSTIHKIVLRKRYAA